MPRKLTEERFRYLMNTPIWDISPEDQAQARRLKEMLQPKLDEIFNGLYSDIVKETEQQLKDAETLGSSTKGFLIPESESIKIKGSNPKFRPGEWKRIEDV